MLHSWPSRTTKRPSTNNPRTLFGPKRTNTAGSQLPALSTPETSQIAISARFPTVKRPHLGRPSTSAPPAGCNFQSLARTHRSCPLRHPLHQNRLASLIHQIAQIIAGRPVDTQSQRHPRIAHLAKRGDPRAKAAIRMEAMRDTSLAFGQ